MEKSREHFEKWYKSEVLNRVTWYQESNVMDDLMIDSDGYYLRNAIQRRWEAWQASRAAIEIELPKTIEVHPLGPSTAKMFCELHKNTVAECAKSIRAAGLKIKGE